MREHLRGWAKNRYSSCYWETRYYNHYDSRYNVVGQISYKITILGKLKPNTRTFKYEAYISNIREYNFPLGMNARLRIGFSISNDESADGKADCKPDPNNINREATFAQWKAGGDNLVAEATFTSPAGSKAKTNEQRDYCQVRAWAYYPDANVAPGLTYRMRSTLRCDSAAYLPSSGCVYYWSIPHLKLTFQDEYGQQISHIWLAINHPQATQPTHIKGVRLVKDIPGGELHKRITRTANEDINKNNRRRSKRFCKRIWGKYYADRFALANRLPSGLPGPQGECDEFPFASTREGAAHKRNGKFANNWSVLVIDGKQNGEWGSGVWGRWLHKERIMDGDTLWINTEDISLPED